MKKPAKPEINPGQDSPAHEITRQLIALGLHPKTHEFVRLNRLTLRVSRLGEVGGWKIRYDEGSDTYTFQPYDGMATGPETHEQQAEDLLEIARDLAVRKKPIGKCQHGRPFDRTPPCQWCRMAQANKARV